MNALLVATCIITCSIQNIFMKQYNVKNPNGKFIFPLISAFMAFLFFVFTAKDTTFDPKVLIYSVAFAVCYAFASITVLLALNIGSLVFTSLFMSYSLLIPTLNGLIFLGDSITIFKITGIVALLISIYLVRAEEKESTNKNGNRLKWWIYVLLGFVTNGMCSVIQNTQKLVFDGKQDSNFMIFALSIVIFIFAICAIIADRKRFIKSFKCGMIYPSLNGIANGVTNLLVIVLTPIRVAPSVFFPLISAGGIVLMFLVSLFVYKEKFITRQIFGVCFGLAALILLNI